jgi:hypothetical protein
MSSCKRLHSEELIIYNSNDQAQEDKLGRTCSTHGRKKNEWWECQKVRDHYEDIEIDGMIILKWIIEKWDEMVWTGFIWLQIRTTGRFLCTF